MSKLAVGQLEGLASESYRITVASGSTFAPVGAILQVVSTTKSDTFSTTSTTTTDVTGLSVTITPKFTSSKILITGNVCWSQDLASPAYLAAFLIDRNGTSISIADAAGSRARLTFGAQGIWATDGTLFSGINFLDSPNSTSALTYKVQCRAESPRTIWVNRGSEPDGDSSITGRFVSTITVMEVAG